VVAGIAHYGNCVGVPTVGGDVYFDRSYEGNPLVNALCLGTLRHDQIRRGKATGVGNPVYYVGAATGRDGLGGAAFASKELSAESSADRPAVQKGDPFMEKLLIEACLEMMAVPGLVVGIQDMGAAGLTCSTCETASRGGAGIEIELDQVPQRETGMNSYEIMLSESQERMLVIVQRGREREIEDIFAKWDLHAANIGVVTDTGRMVVKQHGVVVADIPAGALTDQAPIYQREAREPAFLAGTRGWTPAGLACSAVNRALSRQIWSDVSTSARASRSRTRDTTARPTGQRHWRVASRRSFRAVKTPSSEDASSPSASTNSGHALSSQSASSSASNASSCAAIRPTSATQPSSVLRAG